MILFALAGAAIGGMFGYFGKCSTGACPFTSTWWGGAIFGAFFGLIISNFFAGVPATPKDLNNVKSIESMADFDTEIKNAGDKDVLADFYRSTCPPCRKLMPQLYSFARDFQDELTILKVNAAKNRDLSAKFGIQAVPTLIHIKNGEKVGQRQGYQSAEELKSWIFGSNL